LLTVRDTCPMPRLVEGHKNYRIIQIGHVPLFEWAEVFDFVTTEFNDSADPRILSTQEKIALKLAAMRLASNLQEPRTETVRSTAPIPNPSAALLGGRKNVDERFGTSRRGYRLDLDGRFVSHIVRQDQSYLASQMNKPHLFETKSFREFHNFPEVPGFRSLTVAEQYLPANKIPLGMMANPSRMGGPRVSKMEHRGFGAPSFIRFFDSRRFNFEAPANVLWLQRAKLVEEERRKQVALARRTEEAKTSPHTTSQPQRLEPVVRLPTQIRERPQLVSILKQKKPTTSLILLRGSALALYASARKRGYAGSPNRWLKTSRTARSLTGWYKGISCNRMNTLLRWIDIGPPSPYPEVPERYRRDTFRTPVILGLRMERPIENPYRAKFVAHGQILFVRRGVRFGAMRFLFARGTDLRMLRDLAKTGSSLSRSDKIRKHVRFKDE
jgi:hypothetical protein